jgi:hypothetical protein
MIKKIVLITISVLIFLGITLGGLYYFRNPVWVSNYEEESFEYLDKYLYHYDDNNTLRGVLWMDFINYGDNYLHLFPTNSQGEDIRLPLLSKEFVNIEIGSLNGEVYPVFLSLSFESKPKNILDEILCTYIKGDTCNISLELDSWRIYENTYPFPELSEEEDLQLLDNTLSKYLSSSDNVNCKFRDIMKSGDIAQMVFNNDFNLDSEWDIAEWDHSYLFINMMDNKSEEYEEVKDFVCNTLQRKIYESPLNKLEPSIYDYVNIRTFQEHCSLNLEKGPILIPQEERVLDWESFVSKDLIQSSLYCDLSGFDQNDLCDANINKLISSGLVTSLNSPIDSDGSLFCSKELFYSLKLYIKERLDEKNY